MNRVICSFFILLLVSPVYSPAQSDDLHASRTAISLNIGQAVSNEINLSFEKFVTEKSALELDAGLIYRNDLLRKAAENWTNSQYFYEHGFAARIALRRYKNVDGKSKWRDYIAPVAIYKYQYFNNAWFEADSTNNNGDKFTQCIYQHRFRHKFGLQILWGKIYQLNKTFAVDLYYGLGIRGTISNRTDVLKQDICGQTPVREINFEDSRFYVRPTIHTGVKLRVGW